MPSDQNSSTHDLILDVAMDEAAPAQHTDRERAKWKLLAAKGPFLVDPSRCDIWEGNTRDIAALENNICSELKISIGAVGQQVPAVARISPRDPSRLEVIAGARRLTVIRQINRDRDEAGQAPMNIRLELRDLDDRAAFEVMDSENSGRTELAPIEKARSYKFAIDRTYGTELALAEALGLNKSNVNRTLALLQLPQALLDVIEDLRKISAAQASRFMADWKIPTLQTTLAAAIEEIVEPASAADVFAALREAVAPANSSTVPIFHGEGEIGRVRRNKGGGVTIGLAAEAGPLGWRTVAQATGLALRQLSKDGAE